MPRFSHLQQTIDDQKDFTSGPPHQALREFDKESGVGAAFFNGHEAHLGPYRTAWIKLIDMPWKFMSIGICDWPHSF
jgi:hypothetical protein